MLTLFALTVLLMGILMFLGAFAAMLGGVAMIAYRLGWPQALVAWADGHGYKRYDFFNGENPVAWIGGGVFFLVVAFAVIGLGEHLMTRGAGWFHSGSPG